MEFWGDLLKLILPAALVLYGMYMVVQSFLAKDFERKLLDLKIARQETILPLQLQAYERCIILLERITPHNLLLRMNNPELNSHEFAHLLTYTIREEYSHNLSQQLYISTEAWALVSSAKEEIISLINGVAQHTPADQPGIELAKNLFEELIQREQDPSAGAIQVLKAEIRLLFP